MQRDMYQEIDEPNAEQFRQTVAEIAATMGDLLEVWKDSYRKTNPLYQRTRELLDQRGGRTKGEQRELEALQDECAAEARRRDRIYHEAIYRTTARIGSDAADPIARFEVLRIVAAILLPMTHL